MESLRDLGLSSYEDRAYRGLLGLGTGTAADVTAESDVPKGRIYDALGGLESRGLVRVQSDREPKRYAPGRARSRRRSARRGQTPGAGAPDRDVRVGERRADRPVGRR